MKKAYKILYLIIAIISVLSFLVIGGCDYSFETAGKLSYTEWTDQSGKISFRTVTAGIGNGYITLSGEKVEAEFVFGIKSSIQVSVLSEDLSKQESKSIYELSTEYFSASDVNKQGQVVSDDEDVILFGEHFGRVVLTYTEINAKDTDAWEHYEDWTDSSGKLVLSAPLDGYFSHKFRRAVALTSDGEKEVIFQWLPEEKKFLIFSSDDSGLIKDKLIAEGSYSNEVEEATLTFTTDNLFGGTVDCLAMRVIR